MSIKEGLIFVGVVLSAQGIKGNVIVKSFTMPNTNIIKMNLVDELGEKIILKLLSQNSKGDIICRFNQV
ncbi:MAG TPA: ribosome maturation factor RimM, partial [Rickettsia endosymbiont of Sericostoma sp. HW-2014]|nr:ribosome maturation factor RimM [Rickettsia endosymbiont of Sericostoma sp. HW-2014]